MKHLLKLKVLWAQESPKCEAENVLLSKSLDQRAQAQ